MRSKNHLLFVRNTSLHWSSGVMKSTIHRNVSVNKILHRFGRFVLFWCDLIMVQFVAIALCGIGWRLETLLSDSGQQVRVTSWPTKSHILLLLQFILCWIQHELIWTKQSLVIRCFIHPKRADFRPCVPHLWENIKPYIHYYNKKIRYKKWSSVQHPSCFVVLRQLCCHEQNAWEMKRNRITISTWAGNWCLKCEPVNNVGIGNFKSSVQEAVDIRLNFWSKPIISNNLFGYGDYNNCIHGNISTSTNIFFGSSEQMKILFQHNRKFTGGQ